MLFKKRSTVQGRVRPVPGSRQARREPVFSYYANRSVRSQSAARNGSPLQSAEAPASRVQSKWRPRVYSFGLVAIILLVLSASLRLDTNPKVITVDLNTDKQLFLRDRQTYENAAAAIVRSSVLNSNKLTVNTNDIIAQMQRQFPELAVVSVSLPVVGARPVIYIQPTQPRLVLTTQHSGMYLLDGSGRAVMSAAQVPDLNKLDRPVVADQSGIAIKEGQVALPSGTVQFISEIAGQLRAQNIEVAGYSLPPGANELQVRPAGMLYYVKFNVHSNAREAAGAYLAAKAHLEAEKKTPKEYLDVRVENRVYYR